LKCWFFLSSILLDRCVCVSWQAWWFGNVRSIRFLWICAKLYGLLVSEYFFYCCINKMVLVHWTRKNKIFVTYNNGIDRIVRKFVMWKILLRTIYLRFENRSLRRLTTYIKDVLYFRLLWFTLRGPPFYSIMYINRLL
jgi:hypothetical protein